MPRKDPYPVAQDFDERSVLTTAEVNCRHGSYHVMNGIVILSTGGLHFYGVKHYQGDTIFHLPYVDASEGGGRAAVRLSVTRHFALGTEAYDAFPGAQTYGGRGFIDGINQSRTTAYRKQFNEAFGQAKQKAPALPPSSSINPLVARMHYFAGLSELGAAIYFADLAIEGAQLQPIVQRGPRLFSGESVRLSEAGYSKRRPSFPPLSPQDLIYVKRQRAWMLINAERPSILVEEARKKPDADPEVLVAYALAHYIADKPQESIQLLARAYASDPQNSRVAAGYAWGLGIQERKSEALALAATVDPHCQNDQYALCLLGWARLKAGNLGAALIDLMGSLALARGYMEGWLAAGLALLIAAAAGPPDQLGIAQRLTQLAPDQQATWRGLAEAAALAGDEQTARNAREHLTAL